MAVLPPEYSSVTTDGRAYVTRKSGKLVLLHFCTWRGKGSNLKGYLYCSRPLSATELHKDFYSQKKDAIQVNGRRLSPTSVGEVGVWLERKINDQWYSVASDLD